MSTALVVRKKNTNGSNAYPPDLRRKIVALAKAGKPLDELAKQFPPSIASIRAWVNEANGRPPAWKQRGYRDRRRRQASREVSLPITAMDGTPMLEELRQLREERDYLKNVVLWLVLKLAPQQL